MNELLLLLLLLLLDMCENWGLSQSKSSSKEHAGSGKNLSVQPY